MKTTHSFVDTIAEKVSRYWFGVGVIVILLLASFLRFYQLGQVPHGMTWDEAAIGYNGYALFTKRLDEWNVRFPVSLQSFGDYKAPLAIYANGPFTYFLGMELWVVRLPFALAGVFTVLGTMLFVHQIWPSTTLPGIRRSLALVAGLLVTFSPWHFHFSRAGFESGMALMFVVWGMFFLSVLLQIQPRTKPFQKQWLNWVVALFLTTATALSLAASVYTYHSSKLVMPLLVLIFLVFYWRQAWQQKIWLGLCGAIGLIALRPFILDTLYGPGSERLTQASLFGLKLSVSELVSQTVVHFFRHFTPQYLLFGETITLRHGDGQWGILLPTELIMILAAIFLVGWVYRYAGKKTTIQKNELKVFWLGVVWVVLATLPAAFGRDVPHSNRALLALPGFLLLVLVGLKWSFDLLLASKWNAVAAGSKGEKHLLLKAMIGTFIFCHFSLFLAYAQHYFTDFAKASTADFADGYLEAMQIAKQHEKGVDKILFTSRYGQPYIYALFVRRTDPQWYRWGSLVKFEFTDRIHAGDRDRDNALIVATLQDLEPKPGDQFVYGADGQVRFIIFKTPDLPNPVEQE